MNTTPTATVDSNHWFSTPKLIIAFILVQGSVALSFGLPGHLSVDSLIQLYEAELGQSISFNPPLMSVLLRWFSTVGNPAYLFVLFMQLLYSLSAWLLLRSSGNTVGLRLIMAFVVLSNPIVMIYTGIVWKDVLMAHAAGSLFVVIAWLAHSRTTQYWIYLPICFVLMCLTLGSRQQGIVFVIPAAVALACVVPVRAILKPIVFLISISLVMLATGFAGKQLKPVPGYDGTSIGFRIAIRYDLAGIVAEGGDLSSDINEAMKEEISNDATLYTSYRIDTITTPATQMWGLDLKDLGAIWLSTVLANPKEYLTHRAQHFLALLGFRDKTRCLPLHTGIGTFVHPTYDIELSSYLGHAGNENKHSKTIARVAYDYLSSPLYSHWFYILITVIATVYLGIQRKFVAATYGFCSVALTASFFVVSIACDFRYMYSSVVAATLLTAYSIIVTKRPDRNENAIE